MSSITGRPGKWTGCSGSELDTAPAGAGWSCSVVISFTRTSLLCWLQHIDALRFVLAASPELTLILWINEENERSAISLEFWRWGGKRFNWLLLAWVVSLTKEVLEQRIGTKLDFTSFHFMFSRSPLHLRKLKPKMCVFQVKTLWHVRSAVLWQRFTLANWNASAWVTWTPRGTGAMPKTT